MIRPRRNNVPRPAALSIRRCARRPAVRFDPDDGDDDELDGVRPKRWMLDHVQPDLDERRESQLRNHLQALGFTAVQLSHVEAHPVWQARMNRGAYAGELSPSRLRGCIRQRVAETEYRIEPGDVTVSIRGDTICVVFLLSEA
jgi:hypothetical protein